MSICNRIILEMTEDDGTKTQRILDVGGYPILDFTVSNDFNLQNSSEVFTIRLERITHQSKEFAAYMKAGLLK